MLELAGSGVLTKASHTRCPDKGFSLVCITLMVFPHQEIKSCLSQMQVPEHLALKPGDSHQTLMDVADEGISAVLRNECMHIPVSER